MGCISDAVNQNQINLFFRCSNLHFYMGKISIMVLAFIEYAGFNFAFSAVTKFRSGSPLVVIKKLSFDGQTDHVFLP